MATIFNINVNNIGQLQDLLVQLREAGQGAAPPPPLPPAPADSGVSNAYLEVAFTREWTVSQMKHFMRFLGLQYASNMKHADLSAILKAHFLGATKEGYRQLAEAFLNERTKWAIIMTMQGVNTTAVASMEQIALAQQPLGDIKFPVAMLKRAIKTFDDEWESPVGSIKDALLAGTAGLTDRAQFGATVEANIASWVRDYELEDWFKLSAL